MDGKFPSECRECKCLPKLADIIARLNEPYPREIPVDPSNIGDIPSWPDIFPTLDDVKGMDLKEFIEVYLNDLSAQDKAIVVLTRVFDFPQEKVGELLNLSQQVISYRLSRINPTSICKK